MRFAINKLSFLALFAGLSACGTFGDNQITGKSAHMSEAPASATDEIVEIGVPYTVDGITYTPADNPTYDDVGYASIYSAEPTDQVSSIEENLNRSGVTAAHRTLPLPSYVEVTDINTGRTILVRVNRRGPIEKDKIIQLSEGAFQQLGLTAKDAIGVRVRRVNPPEQERTVLRQGGKAGERIETPDSLLKVLRSKLVKISPAADLTSSNSGTTKPAENRHKLSIEAPKQTTVDKAKTNTLKIVKKTEQKSVSGSYIVQIGAFSSRERADALAKKLNATVVSNAALGPFRVRLGPFGTRSEAEKELKVAKSNGYPLAQIYRN